MPNRIIRESIRRSETLAQLSGDEERLFWRLLVVADDYGRFDGRPEVIRGECFQVMLGKVSGAKVTSWLNSLTRVGLIVAYSVDGRPYLAVKNWSKYQDTRAKYSKWPAPSEASLTPCANICAQMPADVPVSESVSVSEKREAREAVARIRAHPLPVPFVLSDRMREFAQRGGIEDVELVFGAFKDFYRARGTLFVDWVRAWYSWVRKEVDIRAERQRRRVV